MYCSAAFPWMLPSLIRTHDAASGSRLCWCSHPVPEIDDHFSRFHVTPDSGHEMPQMPNRAPWLAFLSPSWTEKFPHGLQIMAAASKVDRRVAMLVDPSSRRAEPGLSGPCLDIGGGIAERSAGTAGLALPRVPWLWAWLACGGFYAQSGNPRNTKMRVFTVNQFSSVGTVFILPLRGFMFLRIYPEIASCERLCITVPPKLPRQAPRLDFPPSHRSGGLLES